MSEVNTNEPVIATEQEPEFVPAKAYKETQADMFKFKSKLKEAEATLNQLKAEKELQERESLKANQEWKLLYEQNEAKLREIDSQRNAEKEQFINYHKRAAVISAIGGFKKEEYANSFINVSNIETDESGNVVQASLLSEVNRIKQSYPELLKGAVANNLPSDAPKSFEANKLDNKDYSKLNEYEKQELKRQLLLKK